jgi:hypothetical protein
MAAPAISTPPRIWSAGTIPAVADIAAVDAGSGPSSITLDGADSVAGLTLNDAAGSLTLSGALSLNSGVVNLRASTLTVSGTPSGGTLIPDGGALATDATDANNDSRFFGSSLMTRSRVRPRRHQRRTVAVTAPAGGHEKQASRNRELIVRTKDGHRLIFELGLQ